MDERERANDRTKARVRTRVAHLFLPMTRMFGFAKVRCKIIPKNAHQVFVHVALVSRYMARKFFPTPAPKLECA